jgi:hypothetical protein
MRYAVTFLEFDAKALFLEAQYAMWFFKRSPYPRGNSLRTAANFLSGIKVIQTCTQGKLFSV